MSPRHVVIAGEGWTKVDVAVRIERPYARSTLIFTEASLRGGAAHGHQVRDETDLVTVMGIPSRRAIEELAPCFLFTAPIHWQRITRGLG